MSNIWQDAIYNRTQADVDRIKELLAKVKFSNMTPAEQTEFLSDSKGALNYSDLARIKNNIELLAEVLEINVTIPVIPNVPTESFYNAIRSGTQAIRNASVLYASTPQVPSTPLNTFSKWNDIEKILHDTYDILMNNFHYYCGEQLYGGDLTALLL